jgi:adenylate cyclase
MLDPARPTGGSMPDLPQPFSFDKLWSELRRRRVIRVVVVYVIVGWVIIEVASTVLPPMDLPGWTVKLVIVLVALGFPIAAVMAWMFDLGPHGIERTAVTPPPGPAVAVADGPAPPRVIPAAPPPATVPTATVTHPPAAAPEAAPAPQRPAATATPGRRTIAVLPFVNMSGDADNEYFSDGIAEEILNLLSKLPQLKVASRTSSFAFKGKEASIRAVAKDLNVDTVLEGSVRRAGEHVRITAQLIDAESDSHLWSETYDREMKDVFAIQDDIAQSIAKALQMTLSPQERRAIQSVATADPEAYDFYLRGRKYMYSMARHDYAHAIRMFEQAIKIDSKYALAYAGMADAYSQMYRYIEATPQTLEHAMRASEQAVALDPGSAEAHASRGLALVINERYDDAESEFRTAVTLNPNLFEAWFYHGLASTSQAKFESSIEQYRKASEINPADYQPLIFLAQAYASLGRKQDEMRVRLGMLGTLERHIRLNPHDTRALYIGAQNLWHVGEHKRASELTEQALGQGQDEPMVLYNVACLYTTQGNHERAIELLEKAVEKGFGDRAWIEHDSDLDPLHANPRFQALLARIH